MLSLETTRVKLANDTWIVCHLHVDSLDSLHDKFCGFAKTLVTHHLYSMDLNTFMDGELLRLPINGVQDGDANLYTIRYASADAVSHEAEDVVTGSPLLTSPEEGLIYNVSGQRLNKMQRGINIVGERKVLVK